MKERYSKKVTRLTQPPCMTGEWHLYGGETVDGDAAWDLFCAAADGHLPTIKRLLTEDPRLVHAQYWYSIPLRFAVLGGQAEAVQALLEAGSEPGMTEAHLYDWETFLKDSKNRGFTDVYEVLVAEMKARYGYEPDSEPFDNLRKAIEDGDVRTAKALLKDHAGLARISNFCGNTALHLAAMKGSTELVEVCLNSGAPLEAANYEAHTPFDLGNETVKRALLEKGAVCDFYGACSLGDLEKVTAMLSEEPDLAKKLYRSFNSPLTAAAQEGHLEVVTTLLDHGANPTLKEQIYDRGGALFQACARGYYQMARLLLERGADPNGPCESSGSSIDHAANDEISALLREHGSGEPWTEASTDPDDLRKKIREGRLGAGENGFDPLAAHVIWSGDSELLALYVEQFGKEPIARLFPGSGPGGWFVPGSGVSGEFLDQLISAGFDINRPSWIGRTHLHFLASRNHIDTAPKFLERGADVNAISLESGTTPLGEAAHQGHQKTVQLLLDHGADPLIPSHRPALQPRALAKQRGHDHLTALL